MDAVQPRRYDQPRQRRFDAAGQPQVGMMEDDRREQQPLPQVQRLRPYPDQPDLRGAPWRRQTQFAEMEPHGGGGVEIEVDVMYLVEAPEPADAMRQDVPQVQRVIEQHDGGDRFERTRQPELRQQSELL